MNYPVDQRYRRPLVMNCILRSGRPYFQIANQDRRLGIQPMFQVKLLMILNTASDKPFAIWPNKVLSYQNDGAPQPNFSDMLAKSRGVIFCGGNRLGQPEVLGAVTVRAAASASVSNDRYLIWEFLNCNQCRKRLSEGSKNCVSASGFQVILTPSRSSWHLVSTAKSLLSGQ